LLWSQIGKFIVAFLAKQLTERCEINDEVFLWSQIGKFIVAFLAKQLTKRCEINDEVLLWSQIGMFIVAFFAKELTERCEINDEVLLWSQIGMFIVAFFAKELTERCVLQRSLLNVAKSTIGSLCYLCLKSFLTSKKKRMSTFFLEDEPLYGVHHDIFQHQNLDRLQEINDRTLSRFVPEAPLPPNFAFRPAMTKYTLFPMLDNRMPAHVPIEANNGPSNMFSPPLMQCGPVAGYQRSVDVEADLRGQLYANNNKCNDATVYVPDSKSDMYRVSHVEGQGTGPNPLHSMLFQQFVWESAIHPNLVDSKVGNALLFNSTRTQLRGEEDAE